VQYDKAAGRWIMTQFAVSGGAPYYQCVAVSTTSDATGSYYRYAFSQPYLNDYPKLGVWPNGYYITFNMFSGNIFVGARACAWDRASMLIGAPASQQCLQYLNSVDSLLPGDLDGTNPPPAGSPNYLVTYGANTLRLWKYHVDFINPGNTTVIGPYNMSVAAFSEACGGGPCIPQLGTMQLLDSIGDRLMYRLAYRNFGDHEALLVNHSIATTNAVGVRWYELRDLSGTPSVYQQGTYAPDGNYRWLGSVAMDQSGNMALGYSLSNTTMKPSIAYTGRAPADPLGTMGSETIILYGSGSQTQTLSRWGDYSSMSIDPVDDCTFWYTNQYLKSDGTFNWSTRIGSFRFPTCGTVSAPDFIVSATPPSNTVTQGSSTSYTITVSSLQGFTDQVNLGLDGLPAGASASFDPISLPGSGGSTLTITTSSSTPAGTYPLTITGTSGSLAHTTTVNLVVAAPVTNDFTLTAIPVAQTVTRGGTASYTVTVAPFPGFNGAVTFTVTGLPNGSSASFSPSSVVASGTSVLSVNTSKGTKSGLYTLTIKGTSGALSHTAKVSLAVQQ
jgi:hypothetical protein